MNSSRTLTQEFGEKKTWILCLQKYPKTICFPPAGAVNHEETINSTYFDGLLNEEKGFEDEKSNGGFFQMYRWAENTSACSNCSISLQVYPYDPSASLPCSPEFENKLSWWL